MQKRTKKSNAIESAWLSLQARVAANSKFLGHAIFTYMQLENISEIEIGKKLGIEPTELPKLFVCFRPAGSGFLYSAKQIACKFDLKLSELVKILRHVESLDAFKKLADRDNDVGTLLAARKKKEDSDEEV